jgi:ubiquinone/menaquinone biosynthesis C-methylase UbiE
MVNPNYYDGIIADWYDTWLKDRTDDVKYYCAFFSGFTGRVLELACGTGRILMPIARSGVQIDGLDSSRDMLSKLKTKLEKDQLKRTTLFNQPMASFSLSEKYEAIFITSGSFQLNQMDDASNCLKSIKSHLTENGFFLMDIFVPWSSIRADKVQTFTVTRDSKKDDGSRCIVSEKFEVDLEKQVLNSVFRYEVFKNDQLEQSLIGDFPLRWYWKDEIKNLLNHAGFDQVEFLTNSPLYKEGSSFVLKAR